MSAQRLTFALVEKAIRGRSFGILSTVSRDGRPHAVGVMYAVPAREKPFEFYVLTDKSTKKARNVASNPNVAFSIPLPRRFLGFVPPNCVQFQGTARVVSLEDRTGREALSRSPILKKILQLEESQREGVFIRISPDPVIFTYGLGLSLLDLVRDIAGASARIEVPRSRLEA